MRDVDSRRVGRAIIIGAPRSGTNILRDVLTALPGVGTWPCDEINYIWRFGRPLSATDVRSPDDATPRVRRYINRQFDRLARRTGAEIVVEKTCANCVRVPFVDTVLGGDAKYIHLVRDGPDAIPSAVGRWKGGADTGYLLRKLRFVPKREFPHYVFRYLRERLGVERSGGGVLPIWGPRVPELETMLEDVPLHLAVAHQWRYCVEAALEDLRDLPDGRHMGVRYEEFVQRPAAVLSRIVEFLDVSAEVSDQAIASAVSDVHANSIGRGAKELRAAEYREVERHIADTLNALGYA